MAVGRLMAGGSVWLSEAGFAGFLGIFGMARASRTDGCSYACFARDHERLTRELGGLFESGFAGWERLRRDRCARMRDDERCTRDHESSTRELSGLSGAGFAGFLRFAGWDGCRWHRCARMSVVREITRVRRENWVVCLNQHLQDCRDLQDGEDLGGTGALV